MARQVAEGGPPAAETPDPFLCSAVGLRASQAYAAATLLAGREAGDLAPALGLANRVIGELNEEGRLYSTVDSVAAMG